MEWISVKDRLPEDDSNVLAWSSEIKNPNCAVDVAFLCALDGKWAGNNSYFVKGITHWMPLPETPTN